LSDIAAGRADLMRKVLQAYLDSAPETVTSLTKSQASGDKKTLGFAAHSLKGSSRTIGAARLGDLCQELENWPDEAHVIPVVSEYRRLLGEIQDYLARSTP
jgi:HPt (histidine-containing phosphotransfer) domain-containing protein